MAFKNFFSKHGKILKEKPKSDEQLEPVPFIVGKDDQKISENLSDNMKKMKHALSESIDYVEKKFSFGESGEFKGCIVYVDGLVEVALISNTVLKPIINCNLSSVDKKNITKKLSEEVIWNGEIEEAKKISELVKAVLKGDTILIVDGCNIGLVINTKGGDKRNIIEPQSESVVRGPREGFTENIRSNTSLIRRKIRNGNLKIEQMVVGKKTQTAIGLLYLKDVAKPEIINTIKKRIKNLEVESILESGYIEQYIEDNPLSIFPTVSYTEKPDVVAAKILEGRIAIVIDGTPFVLTAPMLFIESFQTAEDYYNRPVYASFIRSLRYVAYLISVFAPAIYIALTNFHQELIPTTLLFTIIESREGTPFPVLIEALIMVFAFEFLREAGIRLPRSVGQAVSIVGALIMGDAAVSAGIVGAPIVITVAFTAVCGFLLPVQNNSSSILRVIMMLLAAVVGVFGIIIGFLMLLMYLATLESFGVPYFDSFSNRYDLKDTIIRTPLWSTIERPVNLVDKDKKRVNLFVPPNTKQSKEKLDNSEDENEK